MEDGKPASRAELGLLALVAAFIVASTCLTVLTTFHAIPLQDHWATVGFYQGRLRGESLFPALWAQHNEHRILFPRLFFLVDYAWFGGASRFLVPSILLAQALLALIFGAALAKRRGLEKPDRRFFSLAAWVSCFWLIQSGNFIWGFQITWYLNALFASLAAYLAAGGGWRAGGGSERLRLFAAGCCCVVATYSLASGLFMAGILLVVLWRTGRPRAVLAGWAVFCLVLGATYLMGYHAPSNHAPPGHASPLRLLQYLLAYLGNPVSRFSPAAGMLAGAVGLGLSVHFARRFLTDKKPAFYLSFGAAQIAYALITAGVTAAGRADEGIAQAASSRYFSSNLVFWFFLLTLGYREVKSERGARAIRRGVLAACVLFALPVQLASVPHRQREYLKYDEGALALIAGVRDSLRVAYVYERPDEASFGEQNEFLRLHRLSVYRRDWARALGLPLSVLYAIDSAGAWDAELEKDGAFPPPAGGYFVRGKIRLPEGARAPRRIVFASGDRIVGFAGTAKRSCKGCFTGYVRGLENRDFEAFALEPGGKARRLRTP